MSLNSNPPLSKDWTYHEIDNLDGGVKSNIDSRRIPDNASPYSMNANFVHGHAHIDYGFATFGDTVRGAVKLVRQFDRNDGTNELLMVTDLTFYKYVSAVTQWQYISNGTDTTLTADASGGATSITVADITGFADGEHIGIALDDGTQHKTTVNGTPAGFTINFDDALPGSGVVATSGNAVVEAVLLAGSNDYGVHSCPFPANDWFIFTNNVDNVKRYNGTDCVDVPNLPSSGDTQCRAVALFNNYLLLINTTEGVSSYPQRVRWCDTGDPTNWTTGNAGYEDLYDSDDHLITALDLGPYLIVYRDKSIVRGIFNNTEEEIFAFEPMITDRGCVSVWGAVKVQNYHIVVDKEEIYKYQGGLTTSEVDENIHNLVFGEDGDIEGSQTDKVFTMYSHFLEQVWIFYPVLGDTYPTKVIKYRPDENIWTFRNLPIAMRTIEEYISSNNPIWSELAGSWEDQTWSWSDRASSAGIPSYIVGTNDPATPANNISAVYGLTIADDFGTSIAFEVQTKDFGDPRFDIAWDYFDVFFEGSNLNVSISHDRGATWTLLGTYTNAGEPTEPERIDYQCVGHYTRLKFHSSGGGIHLESLGFSWRIESE